MNKNLIVRKTAMLVILWLTILRPAANAQESWFSNQVPQEIRERNFYKRFEWFHKPRAFPYDTLAINTYHRERTKEVAKQKLARAAGSLTQPEWKSLGPVTVTNGIYYSGRVRGVAVHPTNPDIVYVGAASGGLWKTTDGGTTWSSLSDDFASNTFGAVAIDPNNPEVIYAGTGEVMASGVMNIYDGRGLFKSTDGGNSWMQITDGFGLITQFGDIAVSPHNSEVVFAALGGGYFFTAEVIDNKGIWRSEDAGMTWTRTLALVDSFNTSGGAYDVIVHPTNPNRVYAALGGSGTRGFYVSNDNGLTWTKSGSGLPNHIDRMQIALANSSPEIIYAVLYSTYYTPYRTKVFKSSDEGNTWNEISIGFDFGSSGNDQGSYDLCIVVDPTDADNVYVGNITISHATDGENFAKVPNQYMMHPDYHKIVFAPNNSDYIYVGNDGGLFRSTDAGQTWDSKNLGLATLQLYKMASHPTDKSRMIAGSQDNGGFKTTDYGATPWVSFSGGDVTGVFFDQLDPNIAYAVLYWLTLYKSTDGGLTFQINLGRNFDRDLEETFLIHPTNNQWLYASKDKKVIRSQDGGASWSAISGELTQWPFSTMAQSRVNPDIMILASKAINRSNPQVLISTDGGFNWNEVTANIPGEPRWISRVATHTTEPNTLFVVRSGYGSGKVYRSTDMGASWTDISANLPDIPHSDLFIDPHNASNYFVANDFGVYASQDAGHAWTRLGQGMPIVVAVDFDYYSFRDDRLLRVATYGRGAYEMDLTQLPDWTNPQIAFTSPKPNERLLAGAQMTIRWSAKDNTGITTLEIAYTVDDQNSWTVFPNVSLADTTLIWETPRLNSRGCWIRGVVQDIEGNRAEEIIGPFTINRPPHLASIPDTTVLEDELFEVQPSYSEVDPGDTLEFFDTTPLFDINAATGYISFTPLNAHVGEHHVAIGLSDGLDSDTTEFNIKIMNVNDPPEPFDLTEPPDHAVLDTLNFILKWEASRDIDVGDSLYYNLLVAMDTLFSDIQIEANVNENHYAIQSGLAKGREYFWKVFAIDREHAKTGSDTYFAFQTSDISTYAIREQQKLPLHFALYQNYPNPFNPLTEIRFAIPKDTHAELRILNLIGKQVRLLKSGFHKAGYYRYLWDGKNDLGHSVPTGIYFYQLSTRRFSQVRKMTLLR